jgi:hypothetical protein
MSENEIIESIDKLNADYDEAHNRKTNAEEDMIVINSNIQELQDKLFMIRTRRE